jgi:homoserine dehydrogenase
MINSQKIHICIAGLGTIGSSLIDILDKDHQLILKKTNIDFNILGISAKNKSKKRIFDINKYQWLDDPFELVNNNKCDIFIELIGEEKGLSFDLVKKALENNIHVITANKAMLSKNGNELFKIAEKNNVLLLFEAAIAGGIPIVKVIKQSIFLNKIKKISGILNGTTNFILSEMKNKKLNFEEVLKKAQQNGYAEINPINDIDGIDSAHKLSLLSTLCFGSKINFDNVTYEGISKIDIEDIKNAEKLGCKIKLISESEIVDNKIMSVVEPKLIIKETQLANIDGVLNAVKIESEHLQPLILKGEGAGGQATSSSIISDLYEISLNIKSPSLGYETNQLIDYEKLDISNKLESYYLRILVKDISGVLAKITSNLNEEGISIETILQIPDKNISQEQIPIIIVTHETTKNLLKKALTKIEKLDFVLDDIAVITIDKSIN